MKISQIGVYNLYDINIAIGNPIRSNINSASILVNNNTSTNTNSYISSNSNNDWWEIDLCYCSYITSIILYVNVTPGENNIIPIDFYDDTYNLLESKTANTIQTQNDFARIIQITTTV
jgi:hypothetical protein